MTPQEFFKKNDGKGLDQDGFPKENPYQCMDLMRFFVRDVLALDSSQLRAPTAFQSFQKGGKDFDKFNYLPGMIPQEGDIMYWNQSVGPSGHVSVFVKGNATTFTSFDQNWPERTKSHYQSHDYRGVAGWLRKKGAPKPTEPINNQSNVDYDEEYMAKKKVHERYTLHTIMDFPDNGSLKKFAIKENNTGDFWTVERKDVEEVVRLFNGEFFRIDLKKLKKNKGTINLGEFYEKYPEVLLPAGAEYKY